MVDIVPKRALVFGATGGTGAAIVRETAHRGCAVSAFVRDPQRATALFADMATAPQLLQGDAQNPNEVMQACADGFDVVFDAMGIYQPRAGGTDLTDATRNILAGMQSAGIQRYIGISSLGVGDSQGQGNWLVKLMQRFQLKHTLADKEQQERLIQASGLEWTIVRPARLMNGTGPKQFLAWQGPAPDTRITWAVNRTDVALFAVDCLNDASSNNAAFNIAGRP
jgi:uncharacterized protein YbjT (DUF2867 family)